MGKLPENWAQLFHPIAESIGALISPRSVLTIMVFATTCVLLLHEKTIPPLLDLGCKAFFAVWFGEKALKVRKEFLTQKKEGV